MNIKGILSYPHLFTPRAVNPTDEAKYSVNVLLHKSDPQVAQIQQAIQQAIQQGFPQGFPHTGKVCLKDCAADPTCPPALRDYVELRCSSKDKPHTVTAGDLKPIIDPALVYGGAEAWVAVNIASYSLQMSKGIAAYVNGVAITGQVGALGRIDNRPTVEQMFAGIPGAVPGAAPAFAGAVPPPAFAGAVPPPPGAPVAAPPVAPVAPQYIMTAAANGATREAMHAAGWTDDQLIQHGMMLPPGGAKLPWQA